MAERIDVKNVLKNIESLDKWVGETQTGFMTGTGPKTPAEFLAGATEVRSNAKEIFQAIAKPDSNGIATDPLIKMFQEVILKHEDEIRERIIALISSGEKSALAYYTILQEFVKRESSIAELLPSADKLKETLGTSSLKETLGAASFMAFYGCPACSACTGCVGCAFSLTIGTAGAGAAGAYLAN